MNLRLIREPSWNGATLGALYINGHWECWTLEDVIREVPGEPVSAWKIPGQTAIPAGRYRVVMTHSPRFKRRLPLLVDVSGFSGIRFHAGNDAGDTEGCPLPGRTRADAWVGESKLAFDALFEALEQAQGDVWIDIENPVTERAA